MKFCPECGEKLTSEITRVCPSCGKEILTEEEATKAKEKSLGFFGKMKAAKIIKEARDLHKSGHLYFIKKGDKCHKLCTYDEFRKWSDEELLNATVVDKQNYYVRRGMQKAPFAERRIGQHTDFYD